MHDLNTLNENKLGNNSTNTHIYVYIEFKKLDAWLSKTYIFSFFKCLRNVFQILLL